MLALILAIIISAAHAQSVDDVMVPPPAAEAEDIKTWIDPKCCRTNGCCRKVSPSALVGAPGDRFAYTVVATGQTLNRTDWSRDGQTWRCACDQINGKWVVHLLANTFCIFPAPTGY
jgi:hypothetical protein